MCTAACCGSQKIRVGDVDVPRGDVLREGVAILGGLDGAIIKSAGDVHGH